MNGYAFTAIVISAPVIAFAVFAANRDRPPKVEVVVTAEQSAAAAMVVRANGYACKKVDEIENTIPGRRYFLSCDGRYQYRIEDRGGRWVAEVL